MEGIGSEVSQKIRAAIKAKLIELGAYVDDELPDYIMVMVANKRTKSQMDEDLQLFLSSNTKIFTTWLHTVLQKLQEVTVASFDLKKDSDKKSSKKKKSETDGDEKNERSSEEETGKFKKHHKKHKEVKKSKKAKHKSKDKEKPKVDKKEKSDEREKKIKDEMDSSQNGGKMAMEKSENKSSKSQLFYLNEAVGKAILGNLRKDKRLQKSKVDSSSDSTSSSDNSADPKLKNQIDDMSCKQEKKSREDALNQKNVENKCRGTTEGSEKKKEPPIEDDFNIEPLKPTEKDSKVDSADYNMVQSVASKESDVIVVEDEKTVSVPTEKLLKEHNKLLSQKMEDEEKREKENKEIGSVSEDSISPEEMRKQLLLSRAKRKLENSKLAERMRSNSPDVIHIEDVSNEIPSQNVSQFSSKQGNTFSQRPSNRLDTRNSRLSRSSHSSEDRKCHVEKSSPSRKKSSENQQEERKFDKKRPVPLSKESLNVADQRNCKSDRTQKSDERVEDKRKNVIKISESLEMEKNMGVKKEAETRKEKELSVKKKPISSRVVTITDPEGPEISSIVKVKPREFVAKDKQANKALILKAVADAEKSIATVPVRAEPQEIEPKKTALFTKNLRGKRYEKLAVTLSNIRKSPDIRERLSRRVSVDSDKTERSRNKLDSSEMSEGLRGKSDLLSRKMSKSDDQFISSKTTVMEKNDKYIRCWLEGVEKAVKDDEIVNPNDIEDLNINSNFSIEGLENDGDDVEIMADEIERKRKRESEEETTGEKAQKNKKLSEKELENLRVIPNTKSDSDDGPQIVVTLDGLDSKTIKDIISRNKRAANGPILCEGKDSSGLKSVQKSTSNEPKKFGFEKISDRFGRLNKANEDAEAEKVRDGGDERKGLKREKVDDEKTGLKSTKSKNRELIAQLSEKFGKVDRKFEDRKRRHPEEERRFLFESRKAEREDSDRNGKYKRSDRRSYKEGLSSSSPPPPSKFTSSSSGQVCKYSTNCKNLDCRYYHPKKCRFDEDCSNPECKYSHTETSSRKKSKWYSRS